VVPPAAGDLAGLLIAGGEVARWQSPTVQRPAAAHMSGGAQVSIVVDHPWRASVLVMECARRGLAATCVSTAEHRIGVRTAHSPLLAALAEAWTDGRVRRMPRDLFLDGPQLRLWVEAHGRYERSGAYLLSSGPGEDADRERVGSALAAVGLAAQMISARAGGGHSYRIVGKKRLGRLAEMVGDPPKRAPTDIWPS
jgi:hypothetical protein